MNNIEINDTNYFDHDADIGIIGRGQTLEASFINAAEAMFALMGDLTKVNPTLSVAIDFTESEIELAFVTWLNLLIAQAQANNLILAYFQLSYQNNRWIGTAQGDRWNQVVERGIDVKGATLTMLSVKKIDHLWIAQCVVDV